jgi:hypothetical protein
MRRVSAGFVLLLCIFPAALYSHTLTLMGGMDNFMYDQNDVDYLNRFRVPNPVLVINAGIDGEFSTFSSYNIRFENDPVLRYLASANTTFNLWAFRLGVGAFMSMFNEGNEAFVPGVSGSVGIELPGWISAYVEYGQNISTDLTKPGNISLNYGKLEAAIWLPRILCRFVMERKSFTTMPAETYSIRDSVFRYLVALDFFSKSSSFQLTLGGGYKTLERSIEPGSDPASTLLPVKSDESTTFGFANISLSLNPRIEFLLNVEAPFSRAATGIFLKTVAGFKITIPD